MTTTTTTTRWRQLAQELIDSADAVEADHVRQVQAEQRVGALVTREAMALNAATPLDLNDLPAPAWMVRDAEHAHNGDTSEREADGQPDALEHR